MNRNLPRVKDSVFTEHQGTAYVGSFASRANMIWREIGNTDLGIDGYLEVVVSGAPIGLIAAQVKSGLSYIESPTETSFIFRADKTNVKYWLGYRLPVIVVVYDPELDVAYWRYIQEYFTNSEDVPTTQSVPIRMQKSSTLDRTAIEHLTEIAAYPDSTAHAMLALRATRYAQTQELLTSIELMELYSKRKWLGEWLPLDKPREQLILHSCLAGRGPAWFWFRKEVDLDYVPYLTSAVNKPHDPLPSNAATILAQVSPSTAVPVLLSAIRNCKHAYCATTFGSILGTIPSLATEERLDIAEALWDCFDRDDFSPSGIHLGLLSAIAKVGGPIVRDRVVQKYEYAVGDRAPSNSLPLLKAAACMWERSDLPLLRDLVRGSSTSLKALAVVALAELGQHEDLELIAEYVRSVRWFDNDDVHWLGKQASRLYEARDLDSVTREVASGNGRAAYAHAVVHEIATRLDVASLIQLFTSTSASLKMCAINGLVATGNASMLKGHFGLIDAFSRYDLFLAKKLAMGIAASGDLELINRLHDVDLYNVYDDIAEGLRHVSSVPVIEMLLHLFFNSAQPLEAGKSLALKGDEGTLQLLLTWLMNNPYEQLADVTKSVVIHLDRRLYGPAYMGKDLDYDFSMLRYSFRKEQE